MKKLIFLVCLLAAQMSFAVWGPPSDYVTVNSNGWAYLNPTATTAQAVFNWLNVNASNYNFSLKGTNIIGAVFTNGQWMIVSNDLSSLFTTGKFDFVRNESLGAYSNWIVKVYTNWDLTAHEEGGTNTVTVFEHPPYVVQDNILFPAFVTKEEFYAILNLLGFANYDSFTYVSAATYGDCTNPPANTDVQVWQVPWTNSVQFTNNQRIKVHCWGGGSGNSIYYHPGGYASGFLTITNALDATIASSCTQGMWFCVQVGPQSGRAAIWRKDASLGYFHTYTNEILVAGGAGENGWQGRSGIYGGYGGGVIGGTGDTTSIGGSYYGYQYGGYPGSTNGGAGAGGTATRGSDGAGDIATGGNGKRVWGGFEYKPPGGGGDGYWGGGAGGYRRVTSSGDPTHYSGCAGGGGGCGFYAPSLVEGSISNAADLIAVPPGVWETAYGDEAGYPGNYARVAFEIQFGISLTNLPAP